ncbi:MAG: ATP-binding protein [Thermodesulfovibrionales bacterium]|nr:ATP-binding protein [Thermodesulfovibrionales bacterium]
MQQVNLLNYYLLGRVIFAIALQISFHFAADYFSIGKVPLLIGVYGFIAFLRLIINPDKCHPLDFVLDILFVTGIVYVSFNYYSYTYLTMLYLFPIFFASVAIKDTKAYVFPILGVALYSGVYLSSEILLEKTSLINIFLHGIAFVLIFYAGRQLSIKITNQESLIKRLEEERIRIQGYERLFRVSADLAHELRNPLASISAAIQFIKEGKDAKYFINMLDEEVNRVSRIIKEFLMFARPSDAPKEMVDISDIIKKVVSDNTVSTVKISLDIDNSIVINANRTFMEIAIGNIIKNAFESGGDTVFISAKKKPSNLISYLNHLNKNNPQEVIVIEIHDSGKGISDDIKEKIFEPFMTTKPQGTGLGLAITYRVITDLGGSINIEKSHLGGALFRIILPN